MTTKADGTPVDDDDMRAEYDFSSGQRGRLADRFNDGYEIVVSGPDGEQRIQVSAAEVRAQRAKIERLRKRQARKKPQRQSSS